MNGVPGTRCKGRFSCKGHPPMEAKFRIIISVGYPRRIVTAKGVDVFKIGLQYYLTMDHPMKETFYD
jgi:hypothetical protein